MAGQDNLLSRIAALVAGFDDASWEALASRGLLRRARKDLEKGAGVAVEEEARELLRIRVPPFVVSMPAAGPAKATCSCPAPGMCQHILIAGLFLQANGPSPGTRPPPAGPETIREEIAFFTPERLKAWAGASDYRAGMALLEKNALVPLVEYGDAVLVRLVPSGIEARYVPRGGLEGMILPRLQARRVAVAAILALRRSLGFALPESAEQTSLIETSGSPRTPKEILESASAVLEDAVKIGLSHASPVLVERLVTLAVSAQGANLPRVALSLKTVADEAGSILRREARADESRLLLLMARVYALMEAIRNGGETPDAELAGMHRARYVEVPEIELFGVGAYTWQSGSGYEGLTVLFWCNPSKEFLSWSVARPGTQAFDPRQRFLGEGPWDGAQSPRQVASSHLRLRNARRTLSGRLSGSQKTSALVLSPTPLPALDFAERRFASWSALDAYVRQRQPLGLRDPNPLELIVVLEPTAFGARRYDPIRQAFSWEIHDQTDLPLAMSLPFREWSQEAIRVLETLEPGGASWRIVARAALRDGVLSVEPVSLLRPEAVTGPVFHLAFDALPAKPGAGPEAEARAAEDDGQPDEEETPQEESVDGRHTQLSGILTELSRQLLALAEAGCENDQRPGRQWFEQSQRELHAAGLTLLAGLAGSLAQPTAALPGDVLRARYLAHLHRQAAGHGLFAP